MAEMFSEDGESRVTVCRLCGVCQATQLGPSSPNPDYALILQWSAPPQSATPSCTSGPRTVFRASFSLKTARIMFSEHYSSSSNLGPSSPRPICSGMWQWNIQSPGLSATKAIPTFSRGAIFNSNKAIIRFCGDFRTHSCCYPQIYPQTYFALNE